MSSLTIEMGLRRHRPSDEPPVPEAVASRDDVTLAQKQRLAMLAKMGLGPVADPNIRAPASASASLLGGREMFMPAPPTNHKAALIERERRFREQEEDQQDLFEAARRQRPKPVRPSFPSFQKLGPVQAREEDKLQFLPAPAKEPEPPKPRVEAPAGITIKPIERSKIPHAAPVEEPKEEHFAAEVMASAHPGGELMSAERAILAFLEMQKKKRARAAEREAEEQRQKREKKRRRKEETLAADREDRREDGRDEDDEEEDDVQAHDGEEHRRERHRGPMMVVESVKGKMSNANRNMTDSDLERRFMAQDRQERGSLMTEEQVLRMIRREKADKPAAGSASRRIQKELAEWEAAKADRSARVKSPTRFERMVVARR